MHKEDHSNRAELVHNKTFYRHGSVSSDDETDTNSQVDEDDGATQMIVFDTNTTEGSRLQTPDTLKGTMFVHGV